MLSFGGLLSEVISGGATGLTESDPGIVKILGGFVLSCRFGHVSSWRFGGHGGTHLSPSQDRAARPRATHEQHDGKSPYATSDQHSHTSAAKIFPMAIIKRAIPWWSLTLLTSSSVSSVNFPALGVPSLTMTSLQ